jgi:tRNA A-37 threonylcarbamoyl transferase component Bud32
MRKFRPLTIQIDAPIQDEDSRTTEEILRQKIGPSEILDHALLVNSEVNNNNNLSLSEQVKYLTNVISKYVPIVVHSRRRFDTGEKNTPSYKSYIYDLGNEIVKIINYNCDALSDYVITKEVAAQKYAEKLSQPDKCDFETPSTTKIGKIDLSDFSPEIQNKFEFKCLFFISMSKLSYQNLLNSIHKLNLEEDCEIIVGEINRVISCLEDNQLYHNDLHEENLLINDENGKYRIGLLDYGNATEKQVKLTQHYDCNTLNRIKRSASPVGVGESPTNVADFPASPMSPQLSRFGGKYKQKTKRRRKTKRSQRKTKENVKKNKKRKTKKNNKKSLFQKNKK